MKEYKSEAEKLVDALDAEYGKTESKIDEVPPEFYINELREHFAEVVSDLKAEGEELGLIKLQQRFEGTHSPDFYRGMIAAFRAAACVVDQHRFMMMIMGAGPMLQQLEMTLVQFIPDTRLDADTDLVKKDGTT